MPWGAGPTAYLTSAADERVGARPDALDLDVDPLAGLDRADPRRGAGEEQVPGQEGERRTGVGDQCRDLVDHVCRGAVLDHLAVEAGADREVLDVEVGLDPGADRGEGVEALGPCPLAVAALQVAGSH